MSKRIETSLFCWKVRVWMVLRNWIEPPGCPYTDKCRNACVDCGYSEDRPITAYYQERLKRLKSYEHED